MITLTHVYVLAGLMFAAFAVLTVLDRAHPRRLGTAAFWALLAVSFLFGSWLSDLMNGVLVLLLALLAGFRLLGQSSPPTTSPQERLESAERRGDALFLPALIIPAVALIGVLVLEKTPLFGEEQPTIIALALGVVIALVAAMGVVRVPQKPASMPMAQTTAGLPPNCRMTMGRPTAAVITGKAAKALPMTKVKAAMPTQ